MRNKKFDPTIPMTIQRLRGLRRDQEMVYYRGNFPEDIRQSERFWQSAKYASLLKRVQKEAIELAQSGALKLAEHVIHKRKYANNPAFVAIEYVALGRVGKV